MYFVIDSSEFVKHSIKISTPEMEIASHLVIGSDVPEEKRELAKRYYLELGRSLQQRGLSVLFVEKRNEKDLTMGILLKKTTESILKTVNATPFEEEPSITPALFKLIRVHLTQADGMKIITSPTAKKFAVGDLSAVFFTKNTREELNLTKDAIAWQCEEIRDKETFKASLATFIIDEGVFITHFNNKSMSKIIVHDCDFSEDQSEVTENIKMYNNADELPEFLQESFRFELVEKV